MIIRLPQSLNYFNDCYYEKLLYILRIYLYFKNLDMSHIHICIPKYVTIFFHLQYLQKFVVIVTA